MDVELIDKHLSVQKQVLERILGCEPTEEDFSNVRKEYREGYPETYIFVFKDIAYGWVTTYYRKEVIVEFDTMPPIYYFLTDYGIDFYRNKKPECKWFYTREEAEKELERLKNLDDK